jgi:hypothetical protein
LGGAASIVALLLPAPEVTAAPAPIRIGLFGDSLSVQSEPYFNYLLASGDEAQVQDFAYGGTAACDWLSRMRAYARTKHPRAVVFEFVGNTFTSCMGGCAAESTTAVHRYCVSVAAAIQVFLRLGTHVFLAGTPISRTEWTSHDPDWDLLNRAFALLASHHPGRVTYIDAGKAVEGLDGSYVSTLPCLSFEPGTGPVVDGVQSNLVRSPDGVHFCPAQVGNAVGQVSQCNVYSSGSFRFAAAMAGPLIRSLHLAVTTRRR